LQESFTVIITKYITNAKGVTSWPDITN